MRKYKVSVVTPIYNVEEYLEDCIESVISQTIGFKDNVQLVIINDGSPDNSHDICKRYKEMYPENIVYIEKVNTGVSNSRNIGIEAATGEYLSFLDSDDKLSLDYLENVCKLLDENKDVPFAVGRMKFFDAVDRYHPTDFRFENTRVIDLNDSPNMPQSAIAPLVCRRSQLGSIRFDETMSHLEDAKFIDSLLLECGIYEYGVVRDATYFYRKRQDKSSASDTALRSERYYSSLATYFNFLSESITSNRKKNNIRFIEFNALYRLGWSIDQPQKPEVLTDSLWMDYKDSLRKLIYALSNDVIIEGGASMNLRKKMTILRVKYFDTSSSILEQINDPRLVSKLVSEQAVVITNINHRGVLGVVLDGFVHVADYHTVGLKLDIFFDGEQITYEPKNRYAKFLDEEITTMSGFQVTIPLESYGNLVFRLSNHDGSVDKTLTPVYMRTSRVGMRQNDYRLLKASTLILPYQSHIEIAQFTIGKVFAREVKLFAQSLLINKHKIKRNALKTVAIEALRVWVLLRLKLLGSSRVWLFSDRTISGGDNSEVLFRYVSENSDSQVKPYFVVNKNTQTYQQLKRDGYNVVGYRTIRHLYLSVISEMMLTSHLDEIYFYPWHALHRKYFGLSQFEIVHTQHGIALNDMSSYVGKVAKDANIFLSVCDWEQKGLLSDKYGYDTAQVPVTGLPRYDALKDTSDEIKPKIIAIHPTWRPWASGKNENGQRLRNDHFTDTEYFNFYQNLINDTRLIDALKKYDYRIKFYIHPNHASNVEDFSTNSELVDVMKFPYRYNDMFSESSLFITDYSNTLFDFAYLRKPVIHLQFDRGEFFSRHGAMTSGQTFDYFKDGLGPVFDTYEDSIKSIVVMMKSGCKLEDRYKKRIDAFFNYNDQDNSKRAYEYIRGYVDKMRSDL